MKKITPILLLSLLTSSSYSQVLKLGKISVSEQTNQETKKPKKTYEQEIKITRQLDLGEILSNMFPEINHIRKGGIANDINIRGFSRDNINVLIDDTRIYGACPNRMDPPIFHLSTPQVQEIVIKEGAFDITNQGSLTAVVNVKTKEPKKGIHLEAGGTIGSFDYKQGYILTSAGNENIKVLVGYQKQYSKPYETGEGKKITEYKHPSTKNDYQQKYVNNTAFNIDNVWSTFVITPNDENKLKINIAYDDAKDVLYPYLVMDAVYDRTYRITGNYKNKPLGINLSLYYNSVEHDMQDKWRNSAVKWTDGSISTRGYMMKTLAKTKTYGFKLQKFYRLQTLNIKTGIEGFVRNWKADNWIMNNENKGMIPDVDIKNLGIFADINKNLNNSTISFGLRIDTTTTKANKDAFGTVNQNIYQEYYGNNYSLKNEKTYISAYISEKYNFSKNSYVYISLGRTNRVADQQERFIALKRPMNNPDWVGNPNLKLVKNNQLDVGTKIKTGNILFSTNGFFSYIQDYIYITKIQSISNTTKQAVSYKNIDAKFYGLDFSLRTFLSDYFYLDFSGAYQRGQKVSGVDKDIAEIPPAKIRLSVGYDNLVYYGQIEYVYSLEQNNIDETLGERKTPSYQVVNIKAGYKTKKIFFGAGIDNVFDKAYYTHLSYLRSPFSSGMRTLEPGRFIYISASVSF